MHNNILSHNANKSCIAHHLISCLYSRGLSIETKFQAKNGRSLEALEVFAHSIRYLKNEAVELIRENTGDDCYTAKDIQWVLTVPAIWSPAAKQFMREAAYKVRSSAGSGLSFLR